MCSKNAYLLLMTVNIGFYQKGVTFVFFAYNRKK